MRRRLHESTQDDPCCHRRPAPLGRCRLRLRRDAGRSHQRPDQRDREVGAHRPGATGDRRCTAGGSARRGHDCRGRDDRGRRGRRRARRQTRTAPPSRPSPRPKTRRPTRTTAPTSPRSPRPTMARRSRRRIVPLTQASPPTRGSRRTPASPRTQANPPARSKPPSTGSSPGPPATRRSGASFFAARACNRDLDGDCDVRPGSSGNVSTRGLDACLRSIGAETKRRDSHMDDSQMQATACRSQAGGRGPGSR